MVKAAKESCQRLGVKAIDLYQIHAPLHRDSFTDQGLGLADVVDAGLAKVVGVSNFSLEEVRQVHAALASRGIPLASNQVEYSILRQLPDTNGLKAGCEALGVKIIAYSPLAMGRLTGKYSASNEPKVCMCACVCVYARPCVCVYARPCVCVCVCVRKLKQHSIVVLPHIHTHTCSHLHTFSNTLSTKHTHTHSGQSRIRCRADARSGAPPCHPARDRGSSRSVTSSSRSSLGGGEGRCAACRCQECRASFTECGCSQGQLNRSGGGSAQQYGTSRRYFELAAWLMCLRHFELAALLICFCVCFPCVLAMKVHLTALLM